MPGPYAHMGITPTNYASATQAPAVDVTFLLKFPDISITGFEARKLLLISQWDQMGSFEGFHASTLER